VRCAALHASSLASACERRCRLLHLGADGCGRHRLPKSNQRCTRSLGRGTLTKRRRASPPTRAARSRRRSVAPPSLTRLRRPSPSQSGLLSIPLRRASSTRAASPSHRDHHRSAPSALCLCGCRQTATGAGGCLCGFLLPLCPLPPRPRRQVVDPTLPPTAARTTKRTGTGTTMARGLALRTERRTVCRRRCYRPFAAALGARLSPLALSGRATPPRRRRLNVVPTPPAPPPRPRRRWQRPMTPWRPWPPHVANVAAAGRRGRCGGVQSIPDLMARRRRAPATIASRLKIGIESAPPSSTKL